MGNNTNLYITCPSGIEYLLAQELRELGIENPIPSFCGVYVPYSMEAIYRINYLSRLATRVLLPLKTFRCEDRNALYREAKKIDWPSFLTPERTFAIDANVSHPKLRHSLFAAQVLKDALCDVLRDKYGSRPNVNTQNPDIQLNLFINHKGATISFDTSGSPLFKRGWRLQSVEAPLQESLAAAMLRAAGLPGTHTLIDPFCGSGTLLIEAAMMATKTPAGFFRSTYGFFHLPDYSEQEWHACKELYDNQRTFLPSLMITGADKDKKSIEITKAHLEKTGFAKSIEVRHTEIQKLSCSTTLLVTNPPYGHRLNIPRPILLQTYQALGNFIKEHQPESFILTDPELIQTTRLKSTSVYSFSNGGIKVQLYSIKLTLRAQEALWTV